MALEDVLQANGNSDMDEFIERLRKLLYAAWGESAVVFSEAWGAGTDPEDVPLPHITYEVVHRAPNEQLGRGPKPAAFHQFPDPDVPGENINLYRQWFDCTMEFVVYAKTLKEASAYTQAFEEFMVTYTGFFKDIGISEMYFIEETRPEMLERYRQSVPYRILRYYVRLERITEVRSKAIKEVAMSVLPQQSEDSPVVSPSSSFNEERDIILKNRF